MATRTAALIFAIGLACLAGAAPARAQANDQAKIMAQCRAIYESEKAKAKAAEAARAPDEKKKESDKSESEKAADRAADPLHGKSWLEFASGCRAWYLDAARRPAGAAGKKTTPSRPNDPFDHN